MTEYVLRPSSVIEQRGLPNPATPATVLARLSDNSDSTVVTNVSGLLCTWIFALATPSIPADEFVARVGTSIRYKGDTAQYTIGGRVYRSTDPEPSTRFTLTPASGGDFASAQLGYSSVNWALSDIAALRYLWFDGRSSDNFAVTQHADLWSTVFTIKKATATPSNVTESSSAFATVPVAVAATVDWEATTSDWQNLRRVTVEVRIEQGGSGVGTGTLVATASQQLTFTSSGTQNTLIALTDALPNGTFKIYARALRYREDGIARPDQYGDWSTAKTLTMSAPLPAAPIVTAAADQDIDSVIVSVTPVATTNYLGPYIYLERSVDGLNWVPVRSATGIAGVFGQATSFEDYEAPRAIAVYYRARIEATLSSAFINAGAWRTSAAVVVRAETWNLKDPLNPTTNAIGIRVSGSPSEQVTEEQGVFRPIGRKYPVVASGALSGSDGTLSVRTADDQEWAFVLSLFQEQTVLLLESLFGWSKYVRIIGGLKWSLAGTTTTPRRIVEVQYVEVEQPAVEIGATFPTVIIPNIIDGGDVDDLVDDSQDGGIATSTYLAIADGLGA